MSRATWKLSKELRAYVVVRLACFDETSAIVKSLKEDFGIEITRQGVEYYNPFRVAGRACPEEWTTLFHETRHKLIEGRAVIGAAHKMVRVRWLDRMAHQRMAEGNTAEARALLKQAAEEMNERTGHKHGEGGSAYSALSDAEVNARIAVLAAKLGYARVPPGSHAVDGGGPVADEPQPADEPLSG